MTAVEPGKRWAKSSGGISHRNSQQAYLAYTKFGDSPEAGRALSRQPTAYNRKKYRRSSDRTRYMLAADLASTGTNYDLSKDVDCDPLMISQIVGVDGMLRVSDRKLRAGEGTRSIFERNFR